MFSCQILKLTCTKLDFGWSSAADPAGGAYSVFQTLQLDLRGLLVRAGREEKEGETRGMQNSEGMVGEKKRRKERRGDEGGERRQGTYRNGQSPNIFF